MYKSLNEVVTLILRGLQKGYNIGIVYFTDDKKVYDIFYTIDGTCPIYVPDITDIEIFHCLESLKDENVLRNYLKSEFMFGKEIKSCY